MQKTSPTRRNQEVEQSADMASDSKPMPISGNLKLIKLAVLCVLCLQNSFFTVLRRYSQGVLKESYSKHEVLLFGEVVKIIVSAYVISNQPRAAGSFASHLKELAMTAQKMFMLSLIYGMMNILSYVALRNVSAGTFAVCAQLKILTTASFSTLMLNRRYSWTKWRALFTLIIGVLLFSQPFWNSEELLNSAEGNVVLGTAAVLTEVLLSGFASIYFEKVIKTDSEQLNIWERNFQLALGSFPVYLVCILSNGGGEAGYFGGWSKVTFALAIFGAAGGLLVALSIKYGDAILKTLATTGAIVLSSLMDHFFLDGPLTIGMVLAGCIVVTSIFDYTFDKTPQQSVIQPKAAANGKFSELNDNSSHDEEVQGLLNDPRLAEKKKVED
jgi:UDP-sugar transporter A1/2/3